MDDLLLGGLLAALLPLSGCFPTDYGVNDLDPAPTCSKKDCGFDGAFLGGNLDIPNDLPIRIQVDICNGDVCAEPLEFELDAGSYAFKGRVVVVGSGTCPAAPFVCADSKKWWVGWQAPVDAAGGGLGSSLRVVVRALESGDTLEDHSFTATYRMIEPSNCERRDMADGGNERVRCLQFVASWD